MFSILKKLLGFAGPVMSVATSIISPFKLYLLGGVLILIIGLGWTTYHYHGSMITQEITNGVLASKNAELIATIKADGVAVDKLAADSAAREAKAKADLLIAHQEAAKYANKAQVLLNAKPISKDVCKSANALFDQYLGGK